MIAPVMPQQLRSLSPAHFVSCSAGGDEPSNSGGEPTPTAPTPSPRRTCRSSPCGRGTPTGDASSTTSTSRTTRSRPAGRTPAPAGTTTTSSRPAISAGSGAPDVMMVEADRIATFQVQDALVELKRPRLRGREGQLQRRRVEGRLGRRRRLRRTGRRRPDGHDLPHRHLRHSTASRRPPRGQELETAAQKVKDAGGPVFASFARQPAGRRSRR